jgi:AraC-like DNA-binding protein/quercetin dioxygenase-like cupin family protein
VPAYGELIGELETRHGLAAASASRAVFSDLVKGTAQSHAADGVWIKYVARGSVAHTFGARTHVVRAGEFLFAPEKLTSDVEVRTGSEGSTVGVCLFVASEAAPQADAEEPIVFSAACSGLGRLLAAETVRMMRVSHDRSARGAALVKRIEGDLEDFLLDVSQGFAALPDMKSSTRHETLRRLERARGYLHATLDRAAPLAELAQAAGLSRFQLLRQFKQVYGDAPGAYHRKLRLQKAADAVRRDGAPLKLAAEQHGFASASSFSHAWRRTFGQAPFRPRG